MCIIRRGGRRPASPRAQMIQVTTAPAAETRSMSLSTSSSADEDTPTPATEPSQPGPSSLPSYVDDLLQDMVNPPKTDLQDVVVPPTADVEDTVNPPEPEAPAERKEYDCGICGDKFIIPEYTPSSSSNASSTASDPDSSTLELTGIALCGMSHRYCIPCISTYIKTQLADASVKTVFPIRCPECTYQIQDWTAKKILSKQDMEGMWYWARVFEKTPTFYCPIGTCGARVELPSPECSRNLRRVECPACKETFCYRCQVKWHEGQTCAKYARVSGAITLDKSLQKLARRQGWRRCPRCRVVVERNQGCRHISCRCGYQFCYRCGRSWGIGCGSFRSKLCFPLAPEVWPETRSWVAEMIRDLFRRSDDGSR